MSADPGTTPRIDVRTQAGRLPPGQVETRKWPVLHYGRVPSVDLSRWRFTVSGLVEQPLSLSWEDLGRLPQQETVCDIHCVTHWSRYDNAFEGVPVATVLEMARPLPDAAYALVLAAEGYTTNLPLTDLAQPGNLIAFRHNGEPLTPEHGGPVRLLVPHLYFWKSAKWLMGIELIHSDEPGFWEQNGYHMRGDPWAEERYSRPDPARMRRGPRS